jgi:hypothetical protein
MEAEREGHWNNCKRAITALEGGESSRTFDAQMGRNGPLFFFGGCRSNSLDLHHWWVWRSSGLFATPGELAFWQPRVSSIKTP